MYIDIYILNRTVNLYILYLYIKYSPYSPYNVDDMHFLMKIICVREFS